MYNKVEVEVDKTRLVNLFYSHDVITFAKLKTWAPCGTNNIEMRLYFDSCLLCFSFWIDAGRNLNAALPIKTEKSTLIT